MNKNMQDIVSLAKRRGFVFPGSEIYGGFANSYTYGPYGTELKNNIKQLWWKRFVTDRMDVVGIDADIILHPKVWESSGHLAGFNDLLVECTETNQRFRADHLIEDQAGIDVEGWELEKINALIKEKQITSPATGQPTLGPVKNFNLMFSTQMAKTGDGGDAAYLRPETAQAMFVEYKNVLDNTRVKVPFGIAQIGKAFRNEITPGNFIFRRLEFEQMEIEYFIHESDWEQTFDEWFADMHAWCDFIGLKKEHCHDYQHAEEKLSHYSKKTMDIEFDFPFGQKELYGLAYRTDFDLKQHANATGAKLEYRDPQTNEVYTPHVIEPTFGLDRTVLAVMCEAYEEEALEGDDKRVVMRFKPHVAPVKIAILPLMKKDGLAEHAQELYKKLSWFGNCEYDQTGSIGKRYRRQDEIGTPFCVTVDYDSLADGSVTIRDRDTMEQTRVSADELMSYFMEKFMQNA
jgi:glycyl-tRNA synthetase